MLQKQGAALGVCPQTSCTINVNGHLSMKLMLCCRNLLYACCNICGIPCMCVYRRWLFPKCCTKRWSRWTSESFSGKMAASCPGKIPNVLSQVWNTTMYSCSSTSTAKSPLFLFFHIVNTVCAGVRQAVLGILWRCGRSWIWSKWKKTLEEFCLVGSPVLPSFCCTRTRQ